MIMEVKLLIFSGFVVLSCFNQDVLALDTLIRQKRRTTCGGLLNAPQGTVESPNYPSSYPGYSFCIWFITAPKDFRISLSFTSFELESSSTCQLDYLEVRDGYGSSGDLVGKFCGSSVPHSMFSTGNTMSLIFRSDGSGGYRGFKAVFHRIITCGGNLRSDEGDMKSPNYPKNYGINEKCTWTITVPDGYKVMLRFRSFQLEMSPNCEADALAVFDGPNIYSPPLQTICGPTTPNDILSSWNSMTIVFRSDGSDNFRGFSARYSKVKSTEGMLSTASCNIPVLSVVGTMLCFVFLAFM